MYDPPICHFVECPDPYPEPAGYTKGSDGTWHCADGFFGLAEVECEECRATLLLRGCEPIVPCVLPRMLQPCMFDTSDCGDAVDAGEACAVLCRAPHWSGASTTLSCEGNNTDPARVAAGGLPECAVTCLEPDPPPAAYGKSDQEGAWECAFGHVGVAHAECVFGEGCAMLLQLTGCEQASNCEALEDFDTLNNCSLLDVSDCADVPPGGSCTVSCVAPRRGTPAVASCPSQGGQLVWTPPVCLFASCREEFPAGYMKGADGWQCAPGYSGSPALNCARLEDCCYPTAELTGCYEVGLPCETECAPPAPLPAGYSLGADGGWECSAGYAGTVEVLCEADERGCTAGPLELWGCRAAAPCTAAPQSLRASCRYDASSCAGGIAAGGSCAVACRWPYVGESASTSCPDSNLNNDTALALSLPECVLDCAAAGAAPAGYVLGQDGWECAAGYTGTAVASCISDPDTCGIVFDASGCVPTVPCRVPSVDWCAIDVSDCIGLAAGGSCNLRCAAPYAGAPTTAACPAGNTDPSQTILWSAPRCSCPGPSSAPPGYAVANPGNASLSSGAAWRCADGYDGAPVLDCRGAGPGCLAEAQISGCWPVLPCGAAPFVDTDEVEGVLGGTFSFGPAAALGRVSEEGVATYGVYFADACGEPLGATLAQVSPQHSTAGAACCQLDLYQITLDAVAIPEGAQHLLVATSASFPVGVTVPLDDSALVSSTTLSAADKESVVLTMTVGGVSYSALLADSSLRLGFEDAVKQSIVQESLLAGVDLVLEDVSLLLSPGSVLAEATIAVPQGASTPLLQATLSGSTTLREAVAVAVVAVPGISAAVTGDVSVFSVSVEVSLTSSTTTATSTSTTTLGRARAAGSGASRQCGRPFAMALVLWAVAQAPCGR